DRGVLIATVDLVEVHVIGPEPPERRVDRAEDVLAGEAAVVRTLSHRVEDLRRDDEVLALAEIADRPSEDLFAPPLRVHIGRVEEGDAELHPSPPEGPRVLLVEAPGPPLRRAVAHHPEADPGDLQPAPAEAGVLHLGPSLLRLDQNGDFVGAGIDE